jgi:hypothetical protein
VNSLRSEAEKLRNAGYSYKMIREELGIALSTMHYWFKNQPFEPNNQTLLRMKEGPLKVGIRRRTAKLESINKFRDLGIKEVGQLSRRDLWMLGLGIYIGEGSKSIESVRIANADPLVILISIRWMRDICGLSNENISIKLHLYPDNDTEKSMKYWQELTKLPLSSFQKCHIDTRKNKTIMKHGKLPYGTAHLRVVARGDSSKGVILHRRIKGWMTGALNQV